MFAAALIVFREVLEAALIISIILAATRGLQHRNLWVVLGIGAGLAGSGLIAALTSTLSSMFEGSGQEIVNATILFTAVLLIGWHVVWMNSHGRQLAAEMRAVGKSVSDGEKHLSVLAVVIGLAVMREGSEIVLMLGGLWSGVESLGTIAGGATLGLMAGVLVGVLMYAGFLALPIQRVFSLTNGFLVLIAAGMAARGANFLVQAGLIPSLGAKIWDTSAVLPDHSLLGQFLGTLIGYIARPSGVEVLFYGVTMSIVLMLAFLTQRKMIRLGVTALATVLVLTGSFFFASSAKAASVKSPYVVEGEIELEQEGSVTFDRNRSNSDEHELEFEFGYSPTDFWKTSFEVEAAREAGPGEEFRYQKVGFENTFALTEPGQFWIDPALYAEVTIARDDEPNAFTGGVILGKTFGRISNSTNLLIKKKFAPDHSAASFLYRNQVKYRWKPWLEPGFELYGDTKGKDKFDNQELAIGPALFGRLPVAAKQAFKYEIGWLLGATSATADHTIRWKLEYELY